MRCSALILVVISAALAVAPPASGYQRPGELERVASLFALRDAEVRCPSSQEWIADPIWGGPTAGRAWGYANMIDDYIVLHPAFCAGALAVRDEALPRWQRAAGVLVLVHEAFHLRHWSGRRSEGKVECQAIHHFTVGAERLGASPELANDLLPYALAAHQRMVTLFPNYRARGCELPLWALPMSP
jgi:hypothetical protein